MYVKFLFIWKHTLRKESTDGEDILDFIQNTPVWLDATQLFMLLYLLVMVKEHMKILYYFPLFHLSINFSLMKGLLES